jgi:hypothetical protein
MNPIISLLKREINELIAIIITSGNYDKTFYEGKLTEVNDEFITLEISYQQFMVFKYDHFILATPLNRYH